jgi:hypothetical protein
MMPHIVHPPIVELNNPMFARTEMPRLRRRGCCEEQCHRYHCQEQ